MHILVQLIALNPSLSLPRSFQFIGALLTWLSVFVFSQEGQGHLGVFYEITGSQIIEVHYVTDGKHIFSLFTKINK